MFIEKKLIIVDADSVASLICGGMLSIVLGEQTTILVAPLTGIANALHDLDEKLPGVCFAAYLSHVNFHGDAARILFNGEAGLQRHSLHAFIRSNDLTAVNFAAARSTTERVRQLAFLADHHADGNVAVNEGRVAAHIVRYIPSNTGGGIKLRLDFIEWLRTGVPTSAIEAIWRVRGSQARSRRRKAS